MSLEIEVINQVNKIDMTHPAQAIYKQDESSIKSLLSSLPQNSLLDLLHNQTVGHWVI